MRDLSLFHVAYLAEIFITPSTRDTDDGKVIDAYRYDRNRVSIENIMSRFEKIIDRRKRNS